MNKVTLQHTRPQHSKGTHSTTLRCLGFITSARELPRRHVFDCMSAARVPITPAVGVVPLCLLLAIRRHWVRYYACVAR